MDINRMTRAEFEALPRRKWDEDIGEFDSLIILPSQVSGRNLLVYDIRRWLSAHFSWIKEPEIYEVGGMHDSGYRCMDFVAVVGDKPLCRLSGHSDVIHIEGIGGFGHNWLTKYGGCPKAIPPIEWDIDCLAESGLLRLFARGKLIAGSALSSFEIFSAPTQPVERGRG